MNLKGKEIEAYFSNINRSDWELVRFGDVAIQKKGKVDRENTELTRYIAGEHMDSEDIRIRRWGELSDDYLGPAFHRKFEKGDILYGSRRTYLRKVAAAHFDGITANTTFVIGTNEKVIHKDLLPFLMLSEGFAQHSIKNSKGSVNPYVNWKDIASYEFLLPPKPRQARLAELLWAAQGVVVESEQVLKTLNIQKRALFKGSIYKESKLTSGDFGKLEPKWDVVKLGAVISQLQYGISESLDEFGEVPILRMNSLSEGKVTSENLKYFSPKNSFLDKFMLERGDVLFNRTNSYELVGKVGLFDLKGQYSFASYLIRIKTDPQKLDPRYLNFYLNTTIGIGKIRKYRTPGVSQSNINAQNLRKILIPLPDMEFQQALMDKIALIEKAESEMKNRIAKSGELTKSLINQIF